MIKTISTKTVLFTSIIYTSLVAFFVQFILLPFLLPEIHAGNGLLIGFDMNTYHREASEMANLVEESGLKNLKGKGSITAFAAFFYYITGIHEPYVVIPFNALVHSLSAVLIYYLIKLILKDKLSAFFGSVVFIILPTSLFWYAQLHKDGVFILGVLLFIFGYVSIFNKSLIGKKFPLLFLSTLPILGSYLAVLMRPYFAQVIEVISYSLSAVFIIYTVFKISELSRRLISIFVYIFISLSIINTNNFLSLEHTVKNVVSSLDYRNEQPLHLFKKDKEKAITSIEINQSTELIDKSTNNLNELSNKDIETKDLSSSLFNFNSNSLHHEIIEQSELLFMYKKLESENVLKRSKVQSIQILNKSKSESAELINKTKSDFYLLINPDQQLNFHPISPFIAIYRVVDQFSTSLASRRAKYARNHSNSDENFSNIDVEKDLSSLSELIFYIPRAMQIGLTAPFPNQWFISGSTKATSIMRIINGLEMVLYYISFLGAVLIFFRTKELFLYSSVLAYAFLNLFVFTVAIPNIGTLHRIRYGFIMLVVCLGCAQLFKMYIEYKRNLR